MMAAPIVNFNFEEHLVRVVDRDGAPWFVANDICRALCLTNPRKAVTDLDEDERDVTISDTLGGLQSVNIVSEAGVYRLVFRSRKPEAERFKRWLAHEVLPQIRKTGAYAPEEPTTAMAEAVRIDIARDAPLAARVDAVRVARSIFGKETARAMWFHFGLPKVEPDEWQGKAEATNLLARVLDHVLEGSSGRSVREMILDVIDGGDMVAQLSLANFGIRVSEDPEGFWLSNASREIHALFSGGLYSDGSWRMALRRLSGGVPGGRQTFAGRQARTTWFPLAVLDDWCGTRH